jgi:hypothetical protein
MERRLQVATKDACLLIIRKATGVNDQPITILNQGFLSWCLKKRLPPSYPKRVLATRDVKLLGYAKSNARPVRVNLQWFLCGQRCTSSICHLVSGVDPFVDLVVRGRPQDHGDLSAVAACYLHVALLRAGRPVPDKAVILWGRIDRPQPVLNCP